MRINSRLDIEEHLKYVMNKSNFVGYKLYGLRLQDDIKTSLNLFRLLVMPSYRLAYTLYTRQPE
jgi:hypothetical protein